MFVARQRKCVSPSLKLYTKKPIRDYKYDPGGLWVSDGNSIPLPPGLFPYLKWEDDPLEVDITLTPKHNNCLPGVFTVNTNGKKVKFSSGNLFWDGSKFGFEKHQYDYPTSWNPNHVGHFFWSKDARIAQAKRYIDENRDVSDTFFAADNGAIEGLTILSKDEWKYLFEHSLAKNSSSENIITIARKNCIVLKPDGFSGIVADNYTVEEWNAAEASGLVALPLAGYRGGSGFGDAGDYGYYWSSTPNEGNAGRAYYAFFYFRIAYSDISNRYYGYSVRPVSVQ